jgi:hypothetical protein
VEIRIGQPEQDRNKPVKIAELGTRFFLRFALALSRSLAELFTLFFGP